MVENHLLSEILEQPQALLRIYQSYIVQENPALATAAEVIRKSHPIIFSGMCTSEYACYPVSSLLSQAGMANCVCDASEYLYYHGDKPPENSCLILVSQSGNSAEVVHMVKKLKGKLPIIGVFNDETSYLAQHADFGLPILAGPQLACGSKTNLSTMTVLMLLGYAVLGRPLSEAGVHILNLVEQIGQCFDNWEERLAPAVDFLEDSPYTVFLGRGPGRATAMFTYCLFREVPKVVCEGMGAAAFRHGLREMIRPEHRAVIFDPGGETSPLLTNLALDTLAIGTPVLLVTSQDTQLPNRPVPSMVIRTSTQTEEWAPILDVVPGQLMGVLLAERKKIEPGKLLICSNVTTVE